MQNKVLIDRGIAIYKVNDNIDQSSAKKFISSVNLNYSLAKNMKIESVLFSLKNVRKCNGTGLNVLYEKLKMIEKDLKIKVGFSDYSEDIFKLLKTITKGGRVGLFETEDTMLFFLNKLHLQKGDTVVLFEEDKREREKILAEIISRGFFGVGLSNTLVYLKKIKQKSSYAFAMKNLYYPYFGEDIKESLGTEKIKEAHLDGAKKLTKSLVQQLPIFINSTIETFESMIDIKAKKESSKMCVFDITDDSLMASYINFDGKLDGIILLLFPKAFAQKAYDSMFFEETDDDEELKDAMKEFANIIGGRAKALLEEKDLHVNISLPKSYSSLKEIKSSVDKKQGVKVTFSLGGYPLYFFLTR